MQLLARSYEFSIQQTWPRSLDLRAGKQVHLHVIAAVAQAQLSLRDWQLMHARGLSSAAVLQLLSLDLGVNSLTGILPSSWANMTQASTLITVYIPAFTLVRQSTP